jgi:hypothetical protein
MVSASPGGARFNAAGCRIKSGMTTFSYVIPGPRVPLKSGMTR